MKVLELDAGNTRLKWRLSDHGRITARGYLVNDDNWETELPLQLDRFGGIDQALGSVVSGSGRRDLLASIIQAHWGIELQTVQSRAQWRSLTLVYDNPTGFGVDRWLAMLAACHKRRRATRIVVDSGTAMTIDLVDSDGLYLGGYITPGLSLMKSSLQLNTAQLKMAGEPARSVNPGNRSIDCINQGVLAMATAMVNAQVDRFSDAVVFLTGGDAPQLQPFIKAECLYRPELVMDGLALAVREN